MKKKGIRNTDDSQSDPIENGTYTTMLPPHPSCFVPADLLQTKWKNKKKIRISTCFLSESCGWEGRKTSPGLGSLVLPAPASAAGGSRALRGMGRGKEQKIRINWDFAA